MTDPITPIEDDDGYLSADDFPPEELTEEQGFKWRADGKPTNTALGNAIVALAQCWNEDLTVGKVAEVFRLPPERIAEAVAHHYWMYLKRDYTPDSVIGFEGV